VGGRARTHRARHEPDRGNVGPDGVRARVREFPAPRHRTRGAELGATGSGRDRADHRDRRRRAEPIRSGRRAPRPADGRGGARHRSDVGAAASHGRHAHGANRLPPAGHGHRARGLPAAGAAVTEHQPADRGAGSAAERARPRSHRDGDGARPLGRDDGARRARGALAERACGVRGTTRRLYGAHDVVHRAGARGGTPGAARRGAAARGRTAVLPRLGRGVSARLGGGRSHAGPAPGGRRTPAARGRGIGAADGADALIGKLRLEVL